MRKSKNTDRTLVSVIIVNWNGKRYLEKNLSSVFNQSFGLFEIILVDNGSIDDSVGFVRANFPDAIIVQNDENLGFAAGNNRGIEVASGEFILTLNNDTEAEAGFLDRLMGAAKSSGNDVGMWAPKILSMQDRRLIDSVGGLLIYGDGIARGRGRGEADAGQYDKLEEILFPSACCALYRREMLDEIGGFDEDFFAYCEDSDLGLRARLAGWKALSVPDAVVYHHYSGTTGGYSGTKAFLVERNHIWLAVKNFPLKMLLLAPFYMLWRWSVQAAGIISGKGATSNYVKNVSPADILVVLLKTCFSAIKGLPLMLKKRIDLRKLKVVKSREVKVWFRQNGISAKKLVQE